MNLKIEYVKKEDLKPYANNAKLHPAEQIEQIKNSIREFGFNDPIAVWHDNEIIEGHGRLLAAMEMDEVKEVPVIRLDNLTDEQRRAYMLVHNKLTMNTDFDVDLIGIELDDLVNIDLTDLGFSEAEILEFQVDDGEIEQSEYRHETGQQIPDNSMSYTGAEPQQYSGGGFVGFDEYERRANETLTTRRIIIVYRTDEEERFLGRMLMLKENEPLNVVYDASNLMRREADAEPEK